VPRREGTERQPRPAGRIEDRAGLLGRPPPPSDDRCELAGRTPRHGRSLRATSPGTSTAPREDPELRRPWRGYAPWPHRVPGRGSSPSSLTVDVIVGRGRWRPPSGSPPRSAPSGRHRRGVLTNPSVELLTRCPKPLPVPSRSRRRMVRLKAAGMALGVNESLPEELRLAGRDSAHGLAPPHHASAWSRIRQRG
jgi:hypothetical protein